MRAAIAAVVAVVLAAPASIIATFLLLPLWSFIEDRWGIEAVGHASISEWCFVATWIALAVPAAVLAYLAFRPFPKATA